MDATVTVILQNQTKHCIWFFLLCGQTSVNRQRVRYEAQALASKKYVVLTKIVI